MSPALRIGMEERSIDPALVANAPLIAIAFSAGASIRSIIAADTASIWERTFRALPA
ncbi:MAG: hypothetical protein U0990_10460 [Candidatus Nanopelagicales bacterium]|nr:hypothetical protein [Candidatus Nanopelagicales bacterium]MDZ4250496.1 hypothetical protein [Candidatus Nanopelagicales bacterium]